MLSCAWDNSGQFNTLRDVGKRKIGCVPVYWLVCEVGRTLPVRPDSLTCWRTALLLTRSTRRSTSLFQAALRGRKGEASGSITWFSDNTHTHTRTDTRTHAKAQCSWHIFTSIGGLWSEKDLYTRTHAYTRTCGSSVLLTQLKLELALSGPCFYSSQAWIVGFVLWPEVEFGTSGLHAGARFCRLAWRLCGSRRVAYRVCVCVDLVRQQTLQHKRRSRVHEAKSRGLNVCNASSSRMRKGLSVPLASTMGRRSKRRLASVRGDVTRTLHFSA